MRGIPPRVAAVFRSFPAKPGTRLLALRALIFEGAVQAGTGDVEETLKWGEPAYRTKGGRPR